MDLNSLKDMAQNLSMYDLKAGFRKAQNAVMNYTEMEAKVREATNNEPWGASSTLMQEIANGTFSYQTLNEIMPMVYRRFTEKSAEEWRQIYKSLQLLEFLIKHGSERVIDDARSHLTLLKMLRQFHYIDHAGKDQGVNVRNRAKELAELLSDVERIRSERKKARNNRNKYTGLEGGMSRLGGFGSDSGLSLRGSGSGSGSGGIGSNSGYGGYSGGVFGDGGGFGGEPNDYRSEGRDGGSKFEEYDEFDEDERPAASSRAGSSRAESSRTDRTGTTKKTAEPPKKKAPEVDLFSFDDPEPAGPSLSAAPASTNDDDDFDDFQAAPTSQQAANPLPAPVMPSLTSSIVAPTPVSAPQRADLSGMISLSSISPAPSSTSTPVANYSAFAVPSTAPATAVAAQPQQQQPKQPQQSGLVTTAFQAATPNYYQSIAVVPGGTRPSAAPTLNRATSSLSTGSSSTMSSVKPAGASSTSAKPASGGDAFGALWRSTVTKPEEGPAMGKLAREMSNAMAWGGPAPSSVNNTGTMGNTSSGGKAGGGGSASDLLG